jgi:DNA-binding CsgD family transcriptional regulator
MLHGRATELTELDRFLDSAKAGGSEILVIRGEAGIGKSALLDYARSHADGFRIIRHASVASERDIPFAALQLLLRSVTGWSGLLPSAEAYALSRAMQGSGPVVGRQRLLVGMAVVSLLGLLATDKRLLILMDDMHCLDRASADVLGFAARRLRHLPVSFLAASRIPIPHRHGPFPTLRLRGLDRPSAIALLDEHAAGLSNHAGALVVARAAGNPLALIELARALTPEERGGELVPLALRCGPHVEFIEAVAQLPANTRTMLMLAAAECTGDLDIVLRAGRAMGVTADELGPAEDAGLIRVDSCSIVFDHPLIQAAAYTISTRAERLAAHRALATVLDSPSSVLRRARHLAASTTVPDEAVAAQLEQAAPMCGDEAPEIYQQAARLSPDPQNHARRLVTASHAASVTGLLPLAAELADRAAALTDETATVAGVAEARAQLELARGSVPDAGRLLIHGAALVAEEAPVRASLMLTWALRSAWLASDATLVTQCADTLETIPSQRPAARLAHGLSALLGENPVARYSSLRDALPDLAAGCPDQLLVGWAHLCVLDLAAACTAATSVITRADAGTHPAELFEATRILVHAKLIGGQHHEAAAHLRQALEWGQGGKRHVRQLDALRAAHAAFSGDESRCLTFAAGAPGVDRASASIASWALGVARLGQADPSAALEPLAQASHPLTAWPRLADLIEAEVRCGHPKQAGDHLHQLREWAQHLDAPQVDAVLMRCQGLVHHDGARLATAVGLAELANQPFEYARSLLAHGQWLRRSRQRARAREQLRRAVEVFDDLAVSPWAGQARTELRAAGDVQEGASGPLTPQEREIVRLAAGGATNRQIAATLFLSPRTVGYHLYKAYPKLGVRSRRDLLRLNLASGHRAP